MTMSLRRKNRYCYRVKLSAYVRAYKMMYESEDEDEDDDEEDDDEDDEMLLSNVSSHLESS